LSKSISAGGNNDWLIDARTKGAVLVLGADCGGAHLIMLSGVEMLWWAVRLTRDTIMGALWDYGCEWPASDVCDQGEGTHWI